MNRADYKAWADNHANVFGLGENGLAMTGAWYSIFKGFGYTIVELKTATLAMAADPPQFPAQHLARINAAIASRRENESRREVMRRLGYQPDAYEDRGTCVLCGEGGYVVVPHPRFVVNGQWGERHTAAVVCTCWRGRRIVDHNANRAAAAKQGETVKTPMLYAEYVRLNPNWKEQLDEYERALSDFAREVGPAPGREGEWLRLDAAIDRAFQAIRSRGEIGKLPQGAA